MGISKIIICLFYYNLIFFSLRLEILIYLTKKYKLSYGLKNIFLF